MCFPRFVVWLGAFAVICISAPLQAVTPTAEDLARANQWAADNFKPAGKLSETALEPPAASKPGLVVLANHDGVLFNGRPDGRPLKIAETEFRRGLLCHAVSKILVRLPGPGKTFTSAVGVDTNAGGGSIIFSVAVGGKESFRSEVMHCGQRGVPVSVDLAGASEFTIAVDDAGDGISSDHANWADAKATLADGREVWLSELPVLAPELRPRTDVDSAILVRLRRQGER